MMDFDQIEMLEETVLSLEAEIIALTKLNDTLEEVARLTRKLFNNSDYADMDELIGEKDHRKLRTLLSALGYEAKQ